MIRRRPHNMDIPWEVSRDLLVLRSDPEWRHPLRVYLGALIRAGWRQKNLGEVLGFTGERARQLGLNEEWVEQSLEEYRLLLGLALPVPEAPSYMAREPGDPRVRKTHCKYGHPLSGDNLVVWGGVRLCRACNARRSRERYYARRRPRRRAGFIYPNA